MQNHLTPHQIATLLDDAEQGVWVVAADGRVLSTNRTMRRWLETNEPPAASSDHLSLPTRRPLDGRCEGELVSTTGIRRRVRVTTTESEGGPLVQLFQDLSVGQALNRALLDEVTRMARIAGEDELTGVHNRRGFAEALNRIQEDPNARFGVLLIDVDDFKQVNDGFGHAGGDEALIAVARRLQDTLRAGDIVARVGGDEFAVVLPGVEEAALLSLRERIRRTLQFSIELCGREVGLTATIGAAHSDHGRDTVLKRADEQMYASKRRRGEIMTVCRAMADRTLVPLPLVRDEAAVG